MQCVGCEKMCRKVAVDATAEEFSREIQNHICNQPENKNFTKKAIKRKKMICRPVLVRNERREVL